MRARHWVFHVSALAVAALTITACAAARSSSTATPIANVASIAGTWMGTIEFGAGEQPCSLTVEQSGRAVVVARTMTANGTVTVKDGKGSYDFPGRSEGAIILYQDGTKRQLNLRGRSGVFDIWVTPK